MISSNCNQSYLLFGCEGQIHHKLHYSEYITFVCVLMLLILVAVYGNALVILAIFSNKDLRVPRNAFLCSLAFIDLFSPFVRVLPMVMAVINGRWTQGCWWCEMTSSLGVLLCANSILHLCVITLERYLSIRYPLRSKVWITQCKANCVLVCLWLVSVGMAMLPHLTSHVHVYFNHHIMICDIYLNRYPQLSILMASLFFCLPNFLMVGAYFAIYKEIVNNNRRMNFFQPPAMRKENVLHRRLFLEWKTVKTTLVVVGLFFALWLPYFSTVCVRSYRPDLVKGWVERLAITCAYMNSCVNFFVYSVMNSHFQDAFKQFIPFHNAKANLPRAGRRNGCRPEDFRVLHRSSLMTQNMRIVEENSPASSRNRTAVTF